MSNVFISKYKDVFDSIQKRLSRFESKSIENYIYLMELLTMKPMDKESVSSFIKDFGIEPWYIERLLTIHLLTNYKYRPNAEDVFTGRLSWNKMIADFRHGEKLLFEGKENDVYSLIPRYANIQRAFVKKSYPTSIFYYAYLMNDEKSNSWFKNEFGLDYQTALRIVYSIYFYVNDVELRKINSNELTLRIQMIKNTLSKFDNISLNNTISLDEFITRQNKNLKKWDYNFYSMPLTITTNPFIRHGNDVIISPYHLISFINHKIEDHFVNIDSGNTLGRKTEEYFFELFRYYKYSKNIFIRKKYYGVELFDICLSDKEVLVFLDIKSVNIFNNIYLYDNKKAVDVIYRYITQRLDIIRHYIKKNIIIDDIKDVQNIYSIIVFKENMELNKFYLLKLIRERLVKDGYEDMIDYVTHNVLIFDYDLIYEYAICDSNIFSDLKNSDLQEHIDVNRNSENLNPIYHEWYNKLIDEALELAKSEAEKL